MIASDKESMMAQTSEDNAVQSMTYIARYENLADVRDFGGQASETCGLSRDSIYKVELAVDEAFTNIIEHAYGGESQEEIQCTCKIGEDGLTVTLRDCGHPFDPQSVPDPDLDASLEEREPGGLGLFFMRQLMDEVHFSFIPAVAGKGGCNLLTMVKRRENSN